MIAQAKLIAAGAAVAALLASGWYLRHAGYKAGEAACRASVAAQVAEATRKSIEAQTASEATTRAQEARHAANIEDLSDRHRAAVAGLERRLRQLAAGNRPVPEAPATPGAGHGREDGPGLAEGDAGIDRWLADAGVLAHRGIAAGEGAERHRLGLQALQQYGAEIGRFRGEVDRLNGERQ